MVQLRQGRTQQTPDWYQLWNLSSVNPQNFIFLLDPRATGNLPYQALGYYSVEVQQIEEDITYWIQLNWGEIRQDGFNFDIPAPYQGNPLAVRMRVRFLLDGVPWHVVFND